MNHASRPVPDDLAHTIRFHLRTGWVLLFVFLSLGVVLESMHGLKIGYYVDGKNETRRMLWTLAHAHGTLLAVVQIVFALTIRGLAAWPAPPRRLAGRCLLGASVLLPAGFFLGGLQLFPQFDESGDPDPTILLVPVGAALLLIGVLLTARAAVHFEVDAAGKAKS